MRTFATLAALLCFAGPAFAAGRPSAVCRDVLMGDSLAVGMGPYARETGFEVVARQGVGISWLTTQRPRCARRLIIVIGTNDLRGLSQAEAMAYPARVAELAGRWRARQVIWATPGCFHEDASLDQGSIALDRAAVVQRGRGRMTVNRGRQTRCHFASQDGIHTTSAGYRAWWQGLMAPPRNLPPVRRPAAQRRA